MIENMLHTFLEKYVLSITLELALLSLFVVGILVFHRMYLDRQKKRQQKRQQEIEDYIVLQMDTLIKRADKGISLTEADMPILANIAYRMLKVTKGNPHESLKHLFEKMGLCNWVYDQLSNKNLKRKVTAIQLSRHWLTDKKVSDKTKKLIKKLKYLIQNKNPNIRFNAMRTLSYSKSLDTSNYILKALKNEAYSYFTIYEILKGLENRSHKNICNLIKNKNTSKNIRMAAMLILSDSKQTEQITKYIVPLCEDFDFEVRLLAYKICQHTKIPLPAHILKEGLIYIDWRIRFYAAKCARFSKIIEFETLSKALLDNNWLVAEQAAESLCASGENGKRFLQVISQKPSLEGKRAKLYLASIEGV